jgi:hypothetical protein
MAKSAKKHTRARTAPKSGKTVMYRGIKIIPMSGKRSAIAKQICDALWATSGQPRGKTTHR